MASHNAPKNDFAPAWLKIPSQENPKATGSKQDSMSDKGNRARREESYHNSFNRYGPDYARLHRQHSFDNYFDSGQRYPPNQGKYRHHSVDDEFYPYPYANYGYYNGYSGYDKFNMQYNSQPSLFRPPREGKYHHPNNRYGGQMNGGYPGYYDLYPYEYYPNEPPYYPGYPLHPPPGGGKRNYYKDSRTKDGRDRDSDKKRSDAEKEPNFTEDFPSLNGSEETCDPKVTKVQTGGVWENSPLSKSGKDENEGRRDASTAKYKSLIPKSGLVLKKETRMNGSSPLSIVKPSSPTNTQSGKESADRLNARFVTQPKILGDKKSYFLKTLKSDTTAMPRENGFQDHSSPENGEPVCKAQGDPLVNGMHGLEVGGSGVNFLSSSLEAEQRLLREMGWNEQDEEDYVITEDDMKEFQKRTDMAKMTPRNGLVIPKTWSPKHLSYGEVANEAVSSTDSESEEDDS